MTYSDLPDTSATSHSSPSAARLSGGPIDSFAAIAPAASLGRKMVHALNELRAGRMIIVSDDHDREDEADLVMAAEKAGPENTAFMIRYTSGVVCAALTAERATELELPLMVSNGDDPRDTAFTVSVDLKDVTTTGISAADRAATLRALAAPESTAGVFSRPGHIFPLRARQGGVLRRTGHTESAVDLCTLAGLRPVGVLCELVSDDGTMMGGAELAEFADRHRLVRISVADIVRYRQITETLVERAATAWLPTEHGEFAAAGYRSLIDGTEHLALFRDDVDLPAPHPAAPIPVRIHVECARGDIFSSRRCRCREHLLDSLRTATAATRGIVIYLRQDDRSQRIRAEDRPYLVSGSAAARPHTDAAHDRRVTVEQLDLAAQILRDMGTSHISLTSEDAEAAAVLTEHGLRITIEQQVPATGS
jgi:3,4-dihydroxy 2-butanone 4-phosphate synthase/GTP cyclohydrolase II